MAEIHQSTVFEQQRVSQDEVTVGMQISRSSTPRSSITTQNLITTHPSASISTTDTPPPRPPTARGTRTRPATALRFSLRPYASDAFNGFQAKDVPPLKNGSRPGTGAALRGGRKSKIQENPTTTSRTSLSSKAPKFQVPHPTPTPIAIPLPPLRVRKGNLGLSNRNTSAIGRYEDRLKALGLTRAGTEALGWGNRVLALPGEGGRGTERIGGLDEAVSSATLLASPPQTPRPHPRAHTSFPHSMAEVLHLLPRHPRTTAPAFLSLPTSTPSNEPRTRHGSNTSYKQDTSVGVRPVAGTHFWASESERFDRTPFWKLEKQRRSHDHGTIKGSQSVVV
ncbi:hypothetical protein SpCBS45565_g02394 [Spizellomyces sp. 'palustris']|nr:hypothetical protein SpCBS45565_g02394 [Spizellomyces sp. 'palustris']